ncbi:MAG: ADOP family duplicated permease [Bryobacteraceae bacterium]|jgi:predicted permease
MLSDLAYRLRAIFRRRRMESELSEELQFHFERQVEVFIEQGCPPDEARRRARLLFGGLEQVKEECRDARGISFLDTLWQDLPYAARLLAKTPGFAATAVLSMAVGVGSSTLASWLLGQAAFRSLPVKAPEQLVAFRSPGPHLGFCSGAGGSDSTCFSYAMYRDLRDRNTVFSGVLARSGLPANLTFRQRTERVSLELVSWNYFELLGVEPAVGRLFSPGDDGKPDALRVAVLSHEYWARRFAGDPAVVGQRIVLNSLQVTIAGVSARGLHSLIPGRSPDVLVPIEIEETLLPVYPMLSSRAYSAMNIVGRLKPGIARQRAQAELAPVYQQLIEEEARAVPASWPDRERFLSRRLELIPARRGIEPDVDGMLVSLSAIAACVLIAACANLAGLCLARAAARQKEIAIRAALGAGRGRIARQLLAEFLLPAVAGGLLGLLIALGVAGAVPGILFDQQRARTLSSAPDPGVLLLILAVPVLTAILFGAAPALLPALGRPLRALNTGNIAQLGLGQASFRKALVAAQVTLSVGLMFGAFSFSRNLLKERMWRQGPGKENAIAFTIDAGASGYYSPQAARLFQRLEQRLSTMPGARGVGFWAGGMSRFEVEGRRLETPEENASFWFQVSPGWFGAAGCSVVEGRDFGPEREWPPRAVVVNETLKRRLFAGHSPVGKRVRLYGLNRWAEVVGVVREEGSPDFFSRLPSVYYPYSGATTVVYYVRTDRPPEHLLSAVKGLVEREARGAPSYDLKTIDAQYAEGSRSQRVMTAVLCAFGLLTMALAVVGVYGVTAYVVTRRTPEIGVRMALGATAGGVLSMVMKEVGWMIASGAVAGVLLTTIGCGLLFPAGGGPEWGKEYPALAAGTIVVAAAAALAGFLAALRAARIEPTTALRGE